MCGFVGFIGFKNDVFSKKNILLYKTHNYNVIKIIFKKK